MDLELLTTLLKSREKTLLKQLPRFLEKYYGKENVHSTVDYIYAVGDIPVGLVAHLDTVHFYPPKEIFHDVEKQVLWTPEGLGADDRAGVYAIIELIKDGFRPSVIFTTDEETGGLGALQLVNDFKTPLSQLNFLIELDRQGLNDAVYYDCDNLAFEEFISKYGFETQIGSFSDISFIAPEWGIAAVNLSVGYYNEHSYHEFLRYNYLAQTIGKVSYILTDFDPTVVYKYISYKENDFSWLREEETWQSK